ncbi:MAG TPA: helix-turn-helix transcriptional regulator [Williamwhitmania sp.]|nr:helix-turn-helix transcriptional regulator [Williamwhitmania sp.]
MDSTKIIGSNVKKYRAAQGFTQDNLAGFLDVSREMISFYETGKRPIPVTALDKLADLFGVDMEELLEESTTVANTNLAFAFRSDSLAEEDVLSIAEFKRIVLNYLKMKTITNAAGN